MQQTIARTEVELACLHCGKKFKPCIGASLDYCCSGCQTVAQVLKDLGLQKYYDYKDLPFEDKKLALPKGRSYEWLDNKTVLESYGKSRADGLFEVTLPLDGIHCAGCLWVIEELPKIVHGIKTSSVRVSSAEASLTFDPNEITAREIAALLDSLGYPIRLNQTDLQNSESQSKTYLWRLGIAAFVALNTMMLGVSLFQALFTGIEKEYAELFRWVSLVITLPAVTYCAAPFYQNFIFSIRLKRFHIDQPIVVAIVAGFILSVWNTVQGNLYVYYDSIAALVFFMLLGRFIQARALERAREESKLSGEVLPEVATVFIAGDWREQLVTLIKAADKVQVKSSEIIPIDGVICAGYGEIDISILTGESAPQKVSTNDKVYAGTKLVSGQIEIIAETTIQGSRIGKILSELQRIDLSQNFFSSFAEKLSSYFVLITGAIAVFGFFLWLPNGLETAFSVFLTVLIVSCPCALGIAIPAALGISIGRSARRGIYIFDPLVFDNLLKVESYFFDKTGTLTSNLPELVKFENLSEIDFLRLEQIAGALAKATPKHPIARSIINYCSQSPLVADNLKIIVGRGVEGTIDNARYFLGSSLWLTEKRAPLEKNVKQFIEQGNTVTIIATDDRLLGILVFSAEIREGAKQFMNTLNSEKWILSGDSEAAVMHCARELQIPRERVRANFSPEDKAEFIRSYNKTTLMIGDGVNDALALRAATVGVGIKGGLEVTLPVADMYLSSGKIEELAAFKSCVERTNRCIYVILLSSIIYNVIGITLTLYGMMNPLIAAIIMPLNSLGVLALALWWPRYKWE